MYPFLQAAVDTTRAVADTGGGVFEGLGEIVGAVIALVAAVAAYFRGKKKGANEVLGVESVGTQSKRT